MAGGEGVQHYTQILLREIALHGDRPDKKPVTSIFFGGGTPSILPPKALAAILDRIHKAFSVTQNAEISLEANPESFLAFGYAYEVAALGFNRLSLGVQSLDEKALAALGRPHTRREATMACELARAAKFASVNLDLIWGLPGQKRRDWMRDLAAACALQPDHLSCYGLSLEEGTPMAEAFAQGRITLPDEKEQAAMYVDGADYLEAAGYLQYEISNFARMGFQCRHNVGYWENCDYIGFGPSATSTVGGVRRTNPADIPAWQAAVRAGLPDHDAEYLSLKTRALETVMLRLRTVRGLRVRAYRDLTGRDFMRDHRELLHMLHREGLMRFSKGYVRLTRNGMLVSNAILEHLFLAMDARLAEDIFSETPKTSPIVRA